VPTAHPPVEEYLQTIAFLIEEGGPVIQARLAERMHKTPAAVSEIVIRLEADGYLVRHRRQISLTAAGKAIADSVIRRHRLAERLLVDVVGLSWSAAHLEAGRFEHVISELVEERLVEILGDPATCPHGNPIPGSRSAPERVTLVPLETALQGERVRLERLHEDVEDQRDVLEYLEAAGLLPGVEATVTERGPEGTLVLLVGDASIAIGHDLAKRLFGIVLPAAALATAS
jgi:DtxR family transcriptional regulator, Mn-dependent transcriptional regulator